MRFWIVVLVVLVAFAALPVSALAADIPAVGSWNVTSTIDGSQDYNWKLTIKDAEGKLSGTISGEPGDFTLSDVKYADGTLSFRVDIEDQSYHVTAKVDGNKLDGSFKSQSVSGTLKGTRAS